MHGKDEFSKIKGSICHILTKAQNMYNIQIIYKKVSFLKLREAFATFPQKLETCTIYR